MSLRNILAAGLSALALYSGNVSAAQPAPKKVETIQIENKTSKTSSSQVSKTPNQTAVPTAPTNGTSVSTWHPTTIKVDGKDRPAYVLKADRRELYCFEPTPQACEDKYKPTLCVGDECRGNKTTIEPAYYLRLTGGFLMKFDQDDNGLAESPQGAYVGLSYQPNGKSYFGGLELSVAVDNGTATRTVSNGLGEQKRTKDLVDLALTAQFGYDVIEHLSLMVEAGVAVSLANEELIEIGKSKYWNDTLKSGEQNTEVRGVFGGKVGTSIGDFLLEAGAGVETDFHKTTPYFKAGIGWKF